MNDDKVIPFPQPKPRLVSIPIEVVAEPDAITEAMAKLSDALHDMGMPNVAIMLVFESGVGYQSQPFFNANTPEKALALKTTLALASEQWMADPLPPLW
jgi:hypothetical protein